MAKRRIISVEMKPWQYEQMIGFMRAHGFTSVSELVRAMCGLLIWAHMDCVSDGEQQDDIRAMFEEYTYHERQPDGIVPVRKKHKSP